MKAQRRWSWVAALAYVQAGWNLLLFALNPAWGSMVLAWIWLGVGAIYTAIGVRRKRSQRTINPRDQRIAQLRRDAEDLKTRVGALRHSVVLQAGESVLPRGWTIEHTASGTRYIHKPECSHWPRDEVKLADGTVVAYICRRCDHNWASEQYVKSGT